MTRLSLWETGFRWAVGGLLWGLSAALSVVLFLSFSAGEVSRMILLGLLALGFEGAKILTWRQGGSARLLAWLLVGLSVLASFGSALQTVRLLDRVQAPGQLQEAQQAEDRALLDRRIADLENRLQALPEDYLTWYRNLGQDLDRLRQERRSLTLEAETPDLAFSPTLFEELAWFSGWPRQVLELTLLMVLAVALEWGALLLTSSVREAPESPKQAFDPLMTQTFLDTMIALGDGTYLGGRDRVGRHLGLPPYHTKRHFEELVRSGRIKRQGDRMILVDSATSVQ